MPKGFDIKEFDIEDKTFGIGFRYRGYSILKWSASIQVCELFNILYVRPYIEDTLY
jgi:hypothetical protein